MIKPKTAIFDMSALFLSNVLSARKISANSLKVENMWDYPNPTNAKEVHSFLGLASYYQKFIPIFTQMAHCLQELVGLTSNKTKKSIGQRKGEKQLLNQN